MPTNQFINNSPMLTTNHYPIIFISYNLCDYTKYNIQSVIRLLNKDAHKVINIKFKILKFSFHRLDIIDKKNIQYFIFISNTNKAINNS